MRANLTLTKIPRRERDKFRALNRPDTYHEIRKGAVGERVAYTVEMTEAEFRQAQRDAEDPRSNLIAAERDQRVHDAGVPGSRTLDYHGVVPAYASWNGSGVDVGIIEQPYGSSAGCILDTVFSGRVKARGTFGVADACGTGTGHGEKMIGIAIPPRARVAAAAYSGYESTMAEALYWLADTVGVDIINLSQGYQDYSLVVHDAIKNAYAKNILIFASAGNGGEDNIGAGKMVIEHPAKYPEALAISNYRPSTDRIASSSNYGSDVWAATGGCEINAYENLTETYLDDGGTSAAAAVASRLAAMVMTKIKSPGTVRKYLASEARRTGASSLYEGNGVLQLAPVLRRVKKDTPQGEHLDTTPTGRTEGCDI